MWDLRTRGLIEDSAVAAFGEQRRDTQTWRVVPTGGEDRGWLTFEEAIAVVRSIREERGSIDPLIAVALETALAGGWIDRYQHSNVNGRAVYGIEALREDGVPEWAGDTGATRGVLWAMTVMALRDQ